MPGLQSELTDLELPEILNGVGEKIFLEGFLLIPEDGPPVNTQRIGDQVDGDSTGPEKGRDVKSAAFFIVVSAHRHAP